jgi:hypothetical protein
MMLVNKLPEFDNFTVSRINESAEEATNILYRLYSSQPLSLSTPEDLNESSQKFSDFAIRLYADRYK